MKQDSNPPPPTPNHVQLCHWNSLTKHKAEDNKNFKTLTTGHSKSTGPLCDGRGHMATKPALAVGQMCDEHTYVRDSSTQAGGSLKGPGGETGHQKISSHGLFH